MWWGNGNVVGHSCCRTHTRARKHTHTLLDTSALSTPAFEASTIIIFIVEIAGQALRSRRD